MKETVKVEIKHEVLSLITGLAYTRVPSWYGSTMRDLKMDIIVPKVRTKDKKLPLILWFCGGAYRVMDRSVWMPEMMYFARRGFIVASAEYRTSNEATFPEPLIDGKAAVRYLKAHADDFCIDPDRICVMGESAGGTMASLIGVTGGNREFDQGEYLDVDSSVQAVVDLYGLVDLPEISLDGAGANDDVPPWTLKDYLGVECSEEDMKRASAIIYVNEKTPPFFILHGTADTTVPIAQSESFYEKLCEKGVDADLYIIEGAAHGTDYFYQEQIKEKILGFLKKTL